MNERKILVLGSEQSATFPLASGLKRTGWLVITANDAEKALEIARKQRPVAALLHYQVTGGGGIAALRRLRSSLTTVSLPVVGVVPENSPERTEMLEAGVDEFIDPPGSPAEVDAALRRRLGMPPATMGVPVSVLADPKRMSEVRRSGLPGSARDENFDRMMLLASRLIGAPGAFVSVVDVDHQFFKSEIGLPEPWASKRQTPLSHSFCQWVAGGNEELIVSDAREHEILRSNSAIRDLNVIAYAGVPFVMRKGGAVLGSVCVTDSQPRLWNDLDLATLRDVSRVVQSYVALGARGGDPEETIDAVAEGIGAAARLLRQAAAAEDRRDLASVIEQKSHRLAQLVA